MDMSTLLKKLVDYQHENLERPMVCAPNDDHDEPVILMTQDGIGYFDAFDNCDVTLQTIEMRYRMREYKKEHQRMNKADDMFIYPIQPHLRELVLPTSNHL
jgi:hypothetical protein